MKKYIVRNTVISLLIGGFIAASTTNISYQIAPSNTEGACGELRYENGVTSIYTDPNIQTTSDEQPVCGVAHENAIMHPADLLDNKQDSLERFFETASVVSLISFAMLSSITFIKQKKQLKK